MLLCVHSIYFNTLSYLAHFLSVYHFKSKKWKLIGSHYLSMSYLGPYVIVCVVVAVFQGGDGGSMRREEDDRFDV